MRLSLELEATASFPYDLCYHHKLQGFIYSLLRGTRYGTLHDRDGCRFFSFSNLIPPSKMVGKGSRRILIIASPEEQFIETLSTGFRRLAGREVAIGSMKFTVKDATVFQVQLPDGGFGESSVASGTPIVIRIPRYRYEEYEIRPRKDYDYAYWRKEYTPTAFLRQVEENLRKKYSEYTHEQPEPYPIFDRLRFRKQVAVPIQMKGMKSTVIGTLWEFHLQPLNDQLLDMLQFGLDAGFGEMNSLGFGFMNVTEDGSWRQSRFHS